MEKKEIITTLNYLIETCKDGQEGFKTAAENVESSNMKDLFYELSQQRAKYAGELQQVVTRFGEEAEDSGSIAASMHRGWMNLKTAVTSNDEKAILSECERGEDSAVKTYEEALEKDLPGNIEQTVRAQFEGIKNAHDRVKALRDRARAASN